MRSVQWRTPYDVSAHGRGVRALYARILWDALVEAGSAPCHGRTRPALRALARRWLAGKTRYRSGRTRHRRLRRAQPGCRRAGRGRARTVRTVIGPVLIVTRTARQPVPAVAVAGRRRQGD